MLPVDEKQSGLRYNIASATTLMNMRNRLFSGSVGTLYRRKEFFMKKANLTYQLIVMAFLIALEIVFTRFLSIQLPIARIGFGFLPVAVTAIMFGPIKAGICYAIGDVLGMLIFPSGMYFPGFTLSAFITGVLYGLILHNREVTTKRAFLAALAVLCSITVVLNTLWLYIMMGQGFWALIPTRLAEAALMLVVQTITIPFIWNRVILKIPMKPIF